MHVYICIYVTNLLICEWSFMQELFTTIQIAFPRIWKFSICILILFIAFVLSGWLVLGPYHPKVTNEVAILHYIVTKLYMLAIIIMYLHTCIHEH